jgi:hypothetical protein
MTYVIWRRQHSGGGWIQTSQIFQARSDKDAAAKLKRWFSGAVFSSMSLVAVRDGETP